MYEFQNTRKWAVEMAIQAGAQHSDDDADTGDLVVAAAKTIESYISSPADQSPSGSGN